MSINREEYELVLIERFDESRQLASMEPREYLVESGALIERIGQSLRVYIPKKAELVTSSVPPIGTECEAKNALTDTWRKVKVIDHQGSVNSAVCREIGTDKLWWSDSFRPAKTEDEIAKEEKQNWCRDTLLECGHLHPSLELSLLAQSMYDKGYRKQVTQ